ncbi:unnamed protein product, partial [Effrenium voratum]
EAGASRAAPRGARRPRPLLLRTMSGRLRSVESRPGDTVAGLLAEVSRRERSERLELRYGGRRLEESRTLSSYGLRAMSELQLWERGGGLLGGGLCLSTSCEERAGLDAFQK